MISHSVRVLRYKKQSKCPLMSENTKNISRSLSSACVDKREVKIKEEENWNGKNQQDKRAEVTFLFWTFKKWRRTTIYEERKMNSHSLDNLLAFKWCYLSQWDGCEERTSHFGRIFFVFIVIFRRRWMREWKDDQNGNSFTKREKTGYESKVIGQEVSSLKLQFLNSTDQNLYFYLKFHW